MKALFFFSLITSIVFLMTSCGEYGALYLPKKSTTGPVMPVKTNPQIQAANMVGHLQ